MHMVECFYTASSSDCTDCLESQPGLYLTSHTFPVIFRTAIVLINSTGTGTAPSISTAATTQPSPASPVRGAFPGPDSGKCQAVSSQQCTPVCSPNIMEWSRVLYILTQTGRKLTSSYTNHCPARPDSPVNNIITSRDIKNISTSS